MESLLDMYLDADFLSWLMGMMPYVGVGLLLGFIFCILGWLFGLVWSLVRISIR